MEHQQQHTKHKQTSSSTPSFRPAGGLFVSDSLVVCDTLGLKLIVLPLLLNMASSFNTQTRLLANPHYYDYWHHLFFEPDGTVRMTDGGGQVINAKAHGKYRISQTNESSSFELHFSEMVQSNPYSDDKRRLSDFSVKCEKQEGLFAFRREVVWRIQDEKKWPCLLYRSRYVFDVDPLEFGNVNQKSNLYFAFEQKDFRQSTLYYYALSDAQELPADELDQLVAQQANDVSWPAQDFTQQCSVASESRVTREEERKE